MTPKFNYVSDRTRAAYILSYVGMYNGYELWLSTHKPLEEAQRGLERDRGRREGLHHGAVRPVSGDTISIETWQELYGGPNEGGKDDFLGDPKEAILLSPELLECVKTFDGVHLVPTFVVNNPKRSTSHRPASQGSIPDGLVEWFREVHDAMASDVGPSRKIARISTAMASARESLGDRYDALLKD